jgi:integrase
MNQIAHSPMKPAARRRTSPAQEAQRVLANAVKSAANFRPAPSVFGDASNMAVRVAAVFGPYPNRDKWRVIYDQGDRRVSKCFATREEAQAVVETLRASLSSEAKRPIGLAIDEFLAMKKKQGLREVSIKSWSDRLRSHLDDSASLCSVQPRDAQAIYDAMTGQLAAATHRARLRYVRAFFAWCVERGYVVANPFAHVKPIGKPRRGKPQLRVDEARGLLSHLLAEAQRGEDRALGLSLQILHGLRSGEVIKLKARDVDGNGTRLCVAMEGGKTANATRTLRITVPDVQALLMRQKAARAADAWLFGDGHALANDYLWDYLTRVCKRLGLPHVCPHSLRGMHATFAVQDGASAEHVAAVLGHGSTEITRRHYIAPGSEHDAQARSVATLLMQPAESPPQTAEPGPEALLKLLRAMSPAERAALLASVENKP